MSWNALSKNPEQVQLGDKREIGLTHERLGE